MNSDGRVHIGLVLTGGTICSSIDLTTYGKMVVIDLSDKKYPEADLVEKAWVGPGKIQVHVRSPLRKLSEDMMPADWVQIAQSVRELVEFEGLRSVLIFHGTDTASYTAAALSFLLSDLEATVVVTGSNVPAGEEGSDAITNVGDALVAVRSLAPGVYLSFSGTADEPSQVHLGSAVRKFKAAKEAYISPNLGPVARVANGELELLRSWPRRRRGQRNVAIDPNVFAFQLYPGIDLDMIADAMISTGKRGAVVRMYPCATSPSVAGRSSFPNFVKKCTEAGIVVVVCVEQFADLDAIYPSLAEIRDEGAIFAADMIPEIAFVKLAWALAQTNSLAEVERLFIEPIASESESEAIAEDRLLEELVFDV